MPATAGAGDDFDLRDFLRDPAFLREVFEEALAEVGAADESEARFGRFVIRAELGRGAMGIVERAFDPTTRREVALKRIRPELLGVAAVRERFEREGRMASRLSHPNACPVYEVGEVGGVPYLVMPCVEGGTLRARIDAGRGDTARHDAPFEWVALIEKVARALHAAHERGMVHRDVKPSNILVQLDGEPLIVDFGLALDAISDERTRTREGIEPGTLPYMSPEQLAPSGVKPDRRTDVYSLAVVLYECVTGRRPFESESEHELGRLILHGGASPARRVSRAVPRDLSTVVEKGMARERQHRYSTAEAFADDLRRVLRREPIAARPAGVAKRTLRWVQRNPVLAALYVALALGAGTAWVMQSNTAHALGRLEEQRTATRAATAESHYQHARLALREGRYDDAAGALGAAVEFGYDPILLGLARVRVWQGTGDAQRAAAEISALIDAPGVERHLGSVLLLDANLAVNRFLRPDDKVEQIERALATGTLPPAEAHYARALLADTLAESLVELARARVADPQSHEAALLEAQLLLLAGRVADARRIAEWLTTADPRAPEPRLVAAFATGLLGDREGARAHEVALGPEHAAFVELIELTVDGARELDRRTLGWLLGAPDATDPWELLVRLTKSALSVFAGRRPDPDDEGHAAREPVFVVTPAAARALRECGRMIVGVVLLGGSPKQLVRGFELAERTLGDAVYAFSLGTIAFGEGRIDDAVAAYRRAVAQESVQVSRETRLFYLLEAQARAVREAEGPERIAARATELAETLERLWTETADEPAQLRHLYGYARHLKDDPTTPVRWAARWLRAAPDDPQAQAAFHEASAAVR